MPLSKDRNTVLPISKLLKVVVKPYMKLRAHVMFLFHLSGLFCTMFPYDRYPYSLCLAEDNANLSTVGARPHPATACTTLLGNTGYGTSSNQNHGSASLRETLHDVIATTTSNPLNTSSTTAEHSPSAIGLSERTLHPCTVYEQEM